MFGADVLQVGRVVLVVRSAEPTTLFRTKKQEMFSVVQVFHHLEWDLKVAEEVETLSGGLHR